MPRTREARPLLSWETEPVPHPPQPDEVRVWAMSLSGSADDLANAGNLLNQEERARAARFRFDVHRNRFIMARAGLRRVLSACTGTPPESITFQFGMSGKPMLEAGHERGRLEFNLSHSDDLALIAAARDIDVGVDIERIHVVEDMDELVRRFFCAAEIRAFAPLPVDAKPQALFNLWTRKEAWLKATGEGISHLLNKAQVSFLPAEPARLLEVPEGYRLEDWSLAEIEPAAGFTGALAAKTRDLKIVTRTLAN